MPAAFASSSPSSSWEGLVDKVYGRIQSTFQLYLSQPILTKLMILGFLAVHLAAFIFFVFVLGPEKVFDYTAQLAVYLRTLAFPRLTLIFLVCIVSFPPLVGYGTLITLSGMAFGGSIIPSSMKQNPAAGHLPVTIDPDDKEALSTIMKMGSLREAWLVAAFACLLGSFISFNVLRSFLLTSSLGRRLTRIDALRASKQWRAMEKAVGQRGLSMAILVRFSPFPFNVSNLFFASLQSVSLANFMMATATTTPKLLLHVFMGNRLFQLLDKGARAGLDTNAKILNGLYIVVGGLVGMATSWYVYHETNRILSTYEQEEEDQQLASQGARSWDSSDQQERRAFLDEESSSNTSNHTASQHARRNNSSLWE